MHRTTLKERGFPRYTRGEEIFNMVTHIVGAAMALVILVLCVAVSAMHRNVWGIVSSAIYGLMMLIVFVISSVYHGLAKNLAKQVLRIIDHCDIFFLIAGTYTPILLVGIRPRQPVLAWTIFALEWTAALTGATLNAIDLKRYSKFSLICYLVMGWCIVFCLPATMQVMSLSGILWLLAGGISFTLGAVLYVLGAKRRYMHSIFHIFVVLGCFLQFLAIVWYVL